MSQDGRKTQPDNSTRIEIGREFTELLSSGPYDPARYQALRRQLLAAISKLRGGRDVLAWMACVTRTDAPIQIDQGDLQAVEDQLSHLSGEALDIIIETPGGQLAPVEHLVRRIRARYDDVAVIIPGVAKSAGTIFTMAADEILMGPESTLGPIDAQIPFRGSRVSADSLLAGVERMRLEIERTKQLHPVNIPILQNVSPADLDHAIKAQELAVSCVTRWLAQYKFGRGWPCHSDGRAVTTDEREQRAREIASALGDTERWLTHDRSILMEDLQDLRLRITDFSQNPQLHQYIRRYYATVTRTFESSIYKIFETPVSVLCRQQPRPEQLRALAAGPKVPAIPQPGTMQEGGVTIDLTCGSCGQQSQLHAWIGRPVNTPPGQTPWPKDNRFRCPKCGIMHDLSRQRAELEGQLGVRLMEKRS